MDEGNKKNNKKEEKIKANKIWILEQNILPEGFPVKLFEQGPEMHV